MGGLCSCLNDNEEDADETTTLISGRPSATISKASHSSTSTFSANHCPEEFWVPDDEASECQYCKRGFSATNRRHHCRMCGDVFHGGECSTPRGPTDHRVWVCRFCYDYYHKFKNTLFHGKVWSLLCGCRRILLTQQHRRSSYSESKSPGYSSGLSVIGESTL